MKILVKEHGGHTIRLIFPSGLVLNSLSASFLPKYLEEQGIHITREQARVFIKELNRFRKRHKDWKLAEVQDADGDSVEIRL